jgi:hypothetical protein
MSFIPIGLFYLWAGEEKTQHRGHRGGTEGTEKSKRAKRRDTEDAEKTAGLKTGRYIKTKPKTHPQNPRVGHPHPKE